VSVTIYGLFASCLSLGLIHQPPESKYNEKIYLTKYIINLQCEKINKRSMRKILLLIEFYL
jgi:hypothetical protein